MPDPPNTLEDDYQFIKFYLANPCDFGLQIYFETFLAALGKFLLALVAFGLEDVVRGRFRPAGKRGGRHGRRPGRRKPRRPLVPELGEAIAKGLPGFDEQAARHMDDGGRKLWSIDSWGQKWLYRVMIVGLVTEFWADWNSGIIKHPGSHCPTIARALRRDTQHVFNPGGWGQLLINNVIYIEGGILLGPGSVHCFEGNYSVILSARAKIYQSAPEEAEVQLGLALWSDTFEFLDTSSRATIRQGDEIELISAKNLSGPFSLSFRAFASGNSVSFEDLEIWVMQQG